MKRKFLLLVMMCLLGGLGSSLLAQETVQIGANGTTESNIYPYISTYAYSTSQQIYKASEIGKGGTISKIAFHLTDENVNKKVYDVKIYIKHTDKDAFSSKTDWDKTVTSNDLVYDGNPDITNSVLEIPLTTVFNYNGTQNLLVCFDVNSKQGTPTYYRTYNADSKRVMYRRDSKNYGPDCDNYYTAGATSNPTNYIPAITLTFGGSAEAKEPEFNDKYVYPFSDISVTSNPYLKFYVENATHYQVTLSANEDLSDPLYKTTEWVSTNGAKEIQITEEFGLTYTPSKKYYWQVVARNGEDTDAPTTKSTVYSFTTLAAPSEVTNVYPENGATGISNSVTLTWDFASDTEKYQVKIGSNTYPKEDEWFTVNNAKGSFNVSDYLELESGKTYTWSVNVKNAAGSPETITEYTFTTSSIYSVTDYTIKVAKAGAGKNNVTVEWQYSDPTATQYRVNFATTEEVVAQGEWSDISAGAEMGSYTIENVDYSETYYFRVDVTNGNETANGNIVYCLVFDENKDWKASKYNNANDVYIRAGVFIPVEIGNDGKSIAVNVKNVTIERDAYLKVAHQLIADNLTINDGGQLFNEKDPIYYNGFYPIDVKSIKFNMNIVNPEGDWNDNDNKTGWQFIASPFQYTQITSFTENLNGGYDLYKYATKSVEWDNQKHVNGIDAEFETEFVPGCGYLVSYEKDNNVTFTGTVDTRRYIDIVMNEYSGDNPLKNIYLIGNPFTFDMGWKDIINCSWGISDIYVVVNDKGGYEYKQDGAIKVGDGCMIMTKSEYATIYNVAFPFYTPETNVLASRNVENNSLNIFATGKAGKDNVIVNFANERGNFPKLQSFNNEIAEIYVTNDGKRYGAYNYNTNVKEVALNFNAKEMGNYSISLDVNGEFEEVTLVDRFTGIETNMLLEDEYTFTATSNDNPNRFVIRLDNGQQTTDNGQFVYQSGEELILSIEGHVQIVDMLGRVVYSNEHANGDNRISVSEFNNAAYVVRVINEEGVKTQKVVIY